MANSCMVVTVKKYGDTIIAKIGSRLLFIIDLSRMVQVDF